MNKNEKNEEKVVTINEEKNPTTKDETVSENVDTSKETESTQKTTSPKKEKKEKKVKEEKTKKKGTFKKILIIFLVCAIIGAALSAVYFLFLRKTEIDLEKYLKVTYDGYDGFATASVDFDRSLKDCFDDSSVYKKFKKKAEIEIDNNSDLKNGDTIKVKVDISSSWLEENKLKLKDKSIKITVSGLPEAEEIDVFEDLKFTFEGVSPNVSVEVENKSSDKFINTVTYSLSDSYGLANGDEITITAYYDEATASQMGVIVTEDTMKYTIKDQPCYITEKSEVSDEVISEISKEMQDNFEDEIEWAKSSVYYQNNSSYAPTTSYSTDLVAGTPELVNFYLLTKKRNDYSYYSYNYLYGIFKVTYTSQETGATFDWYFLSGTSDIAIDKDGKLYSEDDSYYSDYYYSYDAKGKDELYEDYIESNETDYKIELVK